MSSHNKTMSSCKGFYNNLRALLPSPSPSPSPQREEKPDQSRCLTRSAHTNGDSNDFKSKGVRLKENIESINLRNINPVTK